jgi:hypothetical protein
VAPSREQLRRILVIAHDHSVLRGGRGLSLHRLIEESGYRALRARIEASQLVAMLQAEPKLVDDWIAYSEDKRTSFGWGFGPSREGGWSVDGPDGAREEFNSRFAACADYVLHELDYWLAIDQPVSPSVTADPPVGRPLILGVGRRRQKP